MYYKRPRSLSERSDWKSVIDCVKCNVCNVYVPVEEGEVLCIHGRSKFVCFDCQEEWQQ